MIIKPAQEPNPPYEWVINPPLEDDVCFISFPKSGSTWLSYILLFLIKNGEISTEQALTDNIHWVASSWPYPRSKDELDALPSPRIFKSHMPYHMAVGGIPVDNPCRYIYILLF